MAKVIFQLEAHFKLGELLKYLPIKSQTYFYWKRKFKQADPDNDLKQLIKYIWSQDNHLGVRRIHLILRNQYCLNVNHKKVQRLMVYLNIKGLGYSKRKRKYDSSKGPEGRRMKNRLKRRFKTDRPWQKLVSDMTEFRVPMTNEKVYLEPIMDLYNNEILSYSITSERPDLNFALSPLKKIHDLIPKLEYRTTVHTDQGWQYRHNNWQRILKQNKIFISMSKRATCLDNACIESFFNKLKVELKSLKEYSNSNELINDIEKWIHYYNNNRVQIRLNGYSPIEYKKRNIQT
ncbi:IS3 family transposase [Weissella muntiaci]|uniref:IS3 family transposase n=1 Tax=Weissella muntiaci TaxID=2508881 RepID=UPI002482E9F5|nr:IS3 family transposase [Weissella muntiaci]